MDWLTEQLYLHYSVKVFQELSDYLCANLLLHHIKISFNIDIIHWKLCQDRVSGLKCILCQNTVIGLKIFNSIF